MLLLTLLLGCILPALGGYIPPGPKYACPKESAYIHPCVCLRGSDQGLYVECENTNLASLSLAFINLGNEGMPIEELTIYKCKIGMLKMFLMTVKSNQEIVLIYNLAWKKSLNFTHCVTHLNKQISSLSIKNIMKNHNGFFVELLAFLS